MNRWSGGDNPFAGADWSASWRKTSVSDGEWQELRTELASEAHRWLGGAAQARRSQCDRAGNGIIASIAHLAYHLGAIRQIHRAARGPADGA